MRAFLILAMTAFLGACGFSPMYASPETSEILFQDIRVTGTNESERTGYWLEEALRAKLTASDAPAQTADIAIASSERRVNTGVLATDRATRADLYLTVSYRLQRTDAQGDPTQPIAGKFTSVATYNIPASPYAEVTAIQDARKRAADDIADRIARDIAFQLKK